MTERRKLIEVALPLEAINRESAREKAIRHGHPSTLHLWWARRPLAACRAVLFASLVDDPSSRPEEFRTEEDQERERQRLFGLIEELVKWENTSNETVLEAARQEIRKATGGDPPPVLDPFCGGGSIPLEAQRLGVQVHASDLNPVAVLISKVLVEIPPEFGDRPPINPEARQKIGSESGWRGTRGLAEDVRYYGHWMREEAHRRIGHLYPHSELPDGGEATVIAWLWARTVRCPNPACGMVMPLVRSFALSTKKGSEWHVEPVVDRKTMKVEFSARSGPAVRAGTVGRRGAMCVACETAVPFDYIRAEGRARRIGTRLMAIVSEGDRGRIYASPSGDHERLAASLSPPEDSPDTHLPEHALGFRVQGYGMTKHRDLFTARQLTALTTFGDLVSEARERVLADGGDELYGDAVATALGLVASKSADYWSSLCIWRSDPKNLGIGHVFARQAVQMVWDFAEANPFSASSGNWLQNLEWTVRAIAELGGRQHAEISQRDAMASIENLKPEPVKLGETLRGRI